MDTGVCSASRAKTVVEEFMIPLVGDRQRIYEQTLETMEVKLHAFVRDNSGSEYFGRKIFQPKFLI